MRKLLVKCWWNWHLESISSTFNARFFRTKVFFLLSFWLCNFFVQKRSGKMLMKLTPWRRSRGGRSDVISEWLRLDSKKGFPFKKERIPVLNVMQFVKNIFFSLHSKTNKQKNTHSINSNSFFLLFYTGFYMNFKISAK